MNSCILCNDWRQDTLSEVTEVRQLLIWYTNGVLTKNEVTLNYMYDMYFYLA